MIRRIATGTTETSRVIEQALFATTADGGITCQTKSPGFDDPWVPLAEQICTGYGPRPESIACPGALFALPFDRGYVVVVQVVGQGKDGFGPLAFRFLVVPIALYAELQGDPFRIADDFPPDWDAHGTLATLIWTAGPPPHRTVADVQQVLNVPYSATLLGGVQALLDGGRLVFERTLPDDRLLRALWLLLPVSNRCELCPATFSFGNALGFDVVVVPRADGPEFANYVTEVVAGDYPEGRYELSLQIAAEGGHQENLDALFARRSRGQTMRLGLIILALFLALPLLSLICGPPPAPPPTTEKKQERQELPKEEKP